MIQGDKSNLDFLKELGRTIRPDVVIDTVPSEEMVDPYAEAFPCASNVFFCSSTGTYVPLQKFPADETHPWAEDTGMNFFYQCKRDAKALQRFREKGFPITIFRPSNIIGEDRVPLELWGGRDIEFYRRLRDSEEIVIAEGTENVLIQSGYNWDLARTFVLAIDRPDAVRGEIFNISCKRAITLGQYLETAKDFLNSKSPVRHVSVEQLLKEVPGISLHWGLDFLLLPMCLDIGKAERILGYRPEMTTQQGLVRALESCRQRGLL